jgi:ankyrin repeat domain-containing protein 50
MDPLSFAASLSALATVAFQLVSYIGSVKDGGEERRKLGTQLTTLWMVLQQLQTQFATDLASGDQSWASKLQVLQQPGGIMSQIGDALTVLQAELQSKTGGKKFLMQSLRWPLDKADVDRAIQQIYQLHQLLTGVLDQANIALSQEIRKDGAAVKDVIVGDELKSFLDWISPLNFLQRQQLIFTEARAGTGKWFLDDDRYQQWEREIGSVLWCPGIPGAGKSFLSTIIVDRLQTLQKTRTDQKVAVLMIYFAFDDANSQSPNLILGSLLKQVLQYYSEVPQELRMDFRKHRNDGTRPSHDEIVKALENALAQFDRIYIVMDALDELLEEGKRRELVESVSGLNKKINLLVTSRPIESIRKIFSSRTIYCDGCEDPACLPSSGSSDTEKAQDQKGHKFFYHCVDCEDHVSFDICQACYDKGVVAINPEHEGHEFVKRYCSLSIQILARDEDLRSYVEWRIEGHDTLRRCVDKKVGLRDQILQRVIESAQGM